MNKKEILITGGTGFIGYHLSKKCLELGWSVSSLSTKKPKNLRKLKKVKYIFCDISDKKKLKKKLSLNFDYIVNLAGYVDHSNKEKTLKSHYFGCKNLSSLFLNSKIKKFIQIGSSIEYGKIQSPQKENEFSKINLNSVYGKAKLSSTNFLLDLNKNYSFPVTVLRLYLVYGPYQEANRVIPITILKALKKQKFACSSGKQYRDFLYIDDLISAILKTIKNKKVDGKVLNIGSGKPKKIKQVITKICKVIGSGKPVFGEIQLRKDEILSLYPSITMAKKLLKWKPKIPFNEGLNRTIKFFKNLNE